MSLYLKYRPMSLESVVGNQIVKDTLIKGLATHTLHHAILLHGDTGTGKTTIARILALGLNCQTSAISPCLQCEHCKAILEGPCPDYIEVNAANLRGIDDVRTLVKNMDYANTYLPYRVFVFDECHQWTNEAQNCILKALEEPEPNTYIFLCTTEPTKLLKTVRSRCEEHELRPLTSFEIGNLVEKVCEAEKRKLSSADFGLFCLRCSSNPRKLLTELGKVLAQPEINQETILSVLELPTEEDDANGFEIAKLLMKRDFAGISKLTKNLDKTASYEGMRRVILAYAKSCLLGKTPVQELPLHVLNAFIKPLEESVPYEDFIYRLYGLIYKLQPK